MSEEAVVRVVFPSEKVHKVMKLDMNARVDKARMLIIEKRAKTVPIAGRVPLTDYGLFVPPTDRLPGEWLEDSSTLARYKIPERRCIEFRLKLKPLEVHEPKRPSTHTFSIDYSVPGEEN
jgi:hypothetical protein